VSLSAKSNLPKFLLYLLLLSRTKEPNSYLALLSTFIFFGIFCCWNVWTQSSGTELATAAAVEVHLLWVRL
jgi:hypothetical protein